MRVLLLALMLRRLRRDNPELFDGKAALAAIEAAITADGVDTPVACPRAA